MNIDKLDLSPELREKAKACYELTGLALLRVFALLAPSVDRDHKQVARC